MEIKIRLFPQFSDFEPEKEQKNVHRHWECGKLAKAAKVHTLRII